MGSHWLLEEALPWPSVPFDGPPDVIVVGGGVTGCSCALTSPSAVCVCASTTRARSRAARAGATAASRSVEARAVPGRRRAARVTTALARCGSLSERALDTIETLAGDALRRVGSLRLAADAAERAELEAECEALRADGFAAEWLDALARAARGLVRGRDPAPDGTGRFNLHAGYGGWRRSGGGRQRRSASTAASTRSRTSTRARSSSRPTATPSGLVPELERADPADARSGARDRAVSERLFHGRTMPATASTTGSSSPTAPGHRWERDAAPRGRSATARGGDHADRSGARSRPSSTAHRRPAARSTHRWAGIWGASRDGLPLAGRCPGRDGVWVAGGYSGHGNVLGFACGELVGARDRGRGPPELALFDPAAALGAPGSSRQRYVELAGAPVERAFAIARSWIARPVESKSVISSSARPARGVAREHARRARSPRLAPTPPASTACTSSPPWLACSQSSQKTRARRARRRRSRPCPARRRPSGSRAGPGGASPRREDLAPGRDRHDDVGRERLLREPRDARRRARRGVRGPRRGPRPRRPRAARAPRTSGPPRAPFTPAPTTAAVAASARPSVSAASTAAAPVRSAVTAPASSTASSLPSRRRRAARARHRRQAALRVARERRDPLEQRVPAAERRHRAEVAGRDSSSRTASAASSTRRGRGRRTPRGHLDAASGVTARWTCRAGRTGRASERLDGRGRALDRLLRVREEHRRLRLVEERVVDSGEPGASLRLTTTTFFARSTSMIGIP